MAKHWRDVEVRGMRAWAFAWAFEEEGRGAACTAAHKADLSSGTPTVSKGETVFANSGTAPWGQDVAVVVDSLVRRAESGDCEAGECLDNLLARWRAGFESGWNWWVPRLRAGSMAE